MTAQLMSLPRYRLECDRAGCKVRYEPTDPEISGDPDMLAQRARARVGWGAYDGLDLCRDHKRPSLFSVPVVESSEWAASPYYFCRAGGNKPCGLRSIVTRRRPHGNGHRLYGYCAAHAGGRWVEGRGVYRWGVTS